MIHCSKSDKDISGNKHHLLCVCKTYCHIFSPLSKTLIYLVKPSVHSTVYRTSLCANKHACSFYLSGCRCVRERNIVSISSLFRLWCVKALSAQIIHGASGCTKSLKQAWTFWRLQLDSDAHGTSLKIPRDDPTTDRKKMCS